MTGLFFSVLAILVSLVSAGFTFRMNRRKKLFRKHMLACRQLQLDSVKALKDGDFKQSDLLLMAAQGELEQAGRYS